MAHVCNGIGQPSLDHLIAVCAATPQAGFQRPASWREYENTLTVRYFLPDLPCALPVDFEYHVEFLQAQRSHLLAGRSIVMVENPGVLQEATIADHLLKLAVRDEAIIDAILLLLAFFPGRIGNRKYRVRNLFQYRAQQACFAGARRSRNDKQAADIFSIHSMFWICSRICSIRTLSSTAARVTSVSCDLELRVFASRFSSCIRKSSRRPIGSLRSMVLRTSVK